MSIEVFRGLIYNAALLLALGMIYDAISFTKKPNSLFVQIMTGVYLSSVTVAVMLYPWVLKPGIVFDTRSIILSVIAFFFGIIPTIMAVVFSVIYRLYLGGDGMYVGTAVIVASALCGYLMKRFHHRWKKPDSWQELYALGLLSSILMLSLMLFLPNSTNLVIHTIFFPVIIIYPLITLILGNFVRHRSYLNIEKKELQETKLLFNSLSKSIAPLWMSDHDGNLIWVSQSWLDFRGRTLEQELGNGWLEGLHPDDLAQFKAQGRQNFLEGKPFNEMNRILDYKGEYRTIRNSGNPRFDTEDNLIGFIGISQDITDLLKAEKSLIVSEQKYRSLAETTTDLIIIHRLDGSVVFANQAALRFFGIELPQKNTINIKSFIHQDFYALMETHAEQRRNGFIGSRLYNIELIDSKKQIVPFEVSTSVLSTTEEETELVAVLRNMTERRKEQQALEQSEEKYRSLVDTSTSAIATFNYEGQILFVNKVAAATFRIKPEKMTTKTMYDIFPQDTADFQMDIIREVITTGTPKTTETVASIKGKNTWFHITVVPIFDSNKTAIMAMVNATDITKIKTNELLLQESEKHLRDTESLLQQFIDHIPANAFIKDFDSKYVYVNKHLMDSVASFDWIGKTPFEILNPKDAKAVWDDDQLVKEQKVKQMTSELIETDGSITYLETVRFVIDSEEGQPYIGGVSLDITEQVLAQKEREHYAQLLEQRVIERTTQLQTANTELEAYSFLIAHDLRAPLRAIGGFANIIVEDYSDVLDVEGLRLLNKICYNTDHMQNMIRSLLELAKLERNATSHRTFDMNLLVNNTIKEVINEDILPQFEIKVDNLLDVTADISLLHQVWINLISNAVKFSMPKAEKLIHIGSYKDGSDIVYFIQDTGVGFDINYVERAFGVFSRLHKVAEFEGTGIGLAIVKKVIQLHQGKIWAESEINLGSKFYFSLPISPQTPVSYTI